MMTVTFWEHGFTAEGHAEYADYGQDIICAGISAILQTAALGLEQVVGLQLETEVQEGYMLCQISQKLTDTQRREAAIVLKTAELGLKELRDAYPGHVQLNRR